MEWEGTSVESKVEIDLYYCGDNCDDPVSTRKYYRHSLVCAAVQFFFMNEVLLVFVVERFRQGGSLSFEPRRSHSSSSIYT